MHILVQRVKSLRKQVLLRVGLWQSVTIYVSDVYSEDSQSTTAGTMSAAQMAARARIISGIHSSSCKRDTCRTNRRKRRRIDVGTV